MAKQKTELIDGLVKVEKIGHACIGCMAWESPYVKFKYGDKEFYWHSDNVPEILSRFGLSHNFDLEGRIFAFKGRVRGDRLWRLYSLRGII